MNENNLKTCFVCTEGSFKPYIFLRTNSLQASRCDFCGMVVVSNSPITPTNISNYYTMAAYQGERDLGDKSLYKTYYQNCFIDYDAQDISIQHFKAILNDICCITNCDTPLDLIDIGCATGVFLDIARKTGFNSKGIEISSELAEYAKREFKLEVENDLFSASYPSESVDVITLLDVIEHIPMSDISKTMLEIYRILKPGGVLVIRTPGEDGFLRMTAKILFFLSARQIERPMHLFYSYEHLSSFSSHTLNIFMTRIGFNPYLIKRQEENPARLNISAIGKFILRMIYLISKIVKKEHKILHYYIK